MLTSSSILINGSINQVISPLDRGLSYGDGVFRTLKVEHGLPEVWPLHYQKLVADCGALGIVCPSADSFMGDFQQLFAADEKAAVAKIMVTRGTGERGYKPPAVTSPTRITIKTDYPQYPATYFERGVALYVCNTRLAQQTRLAGVKHLNRLENVLARMEWHDPNFVDGLMLDSADNVIACTAANLFIRNADHLITPDLSQSGVAGITRDRIMALAYLFNLTVEVRAVSLAQLLASEEVIMCNSLFGAWQVNQVAHQTWPHLPLATKIRKALLR